MISNQEQLWRMFCYVGFGVFLGIYAACFTALRRTFFVPKSTVFLHDILACTIFTVVLFVFSLALTGGHLRFISFLSIAVGGWCSYTLLRKPLTQVLRRVFGFMQTLIRVSGRIRAFFAKNARIFAKKVTVFLKKGLHYIHTVVYNHRE